MSGRDAEAEEFEQEIVAAVRQWVDKEVVPHAAEFEHANRYPDALIEQMKAMGVYGLLVPEAFGGSDVSTKCFAQVTEELARGWMSLAGAMGGHSVVVELLRRYGRPDQQAAYLPRLATGEVRAAMALTEPGGGSDLQAMRTVAKRSDDGYVINGSKTWITSAEHAGVCAVLCKTDPEADPPYKGMSVLLVEKVPGFEVGRSLGKLGYKGVESCEIFFSDCRVPAEALLGDEPGQGFVQMMRGLEIGRIQVAARATGVARAAFDAALAYSQQRQAFGVPIWKHQSVGNHLADMATKVTAARQLLLFAATQVDRHGRAALEAGMAKLYASEVCAEVALTGLRVHGGMGYSTELDVERYYRDAPLMIVGEGTNEIQRTVIARELIRRGSLPE
ncbi:MAG TPA: acyl-CoA dehydrogenase family protein [Acidimicrobiales bacterium]|nr:acyl-CoA dehydrogenase family protein [Acidimicrobiales bacterium]